MKYKKKLKMIINKKMIINLNQLKNQLNRKKS